VNSRRKRNFEGNGERERESFIRSDTNVKVGGWDITIGSVEVRVLERESVNWMFLFDAINQSKRGYSIL
jgi:hypothetical protein